MGFIQPNLPVVDVAEWSKGTRAERIVPMARHIAENGFGTPLVMHVMYGVKIALYILGGWFFAWCTTGIGGFGDVAAWWSEPIVFQKAVLFTMLFEVVGLGCCFGPLAGRYFPPMGRSCTGCGPAPSGCHPGRRVPLTKGDDRTPFDALLYGALLVVARDRTGVRRRRPNSGSGHDDWRTPRWQTVAILAVLAAISLRDKVIFLAARAEVYGPLALVFLFAGADIVIGAKLVFMVIWLGAATSKLNRHFPFVISTMLANNPFIPSGVLKRSLFKRYPDDLRPSTLSGVIAHFSTAVEGLVPLALLFSHGGWPTTIAAFVMIVFHLNILLAFPMGVPLEWNIFMIFGVLWLFVAHAHIGLSDLTSPWPVVLFAGHRRCRGPGKPVPAQGFLPARHALLRRQLGHHGVVRQAVGRREVPHRLARARPDAAPATRAVVQDQRGNADPLAPGPRVPRDEHPRARAAHPGAPRTGRLRRGRLQPVRGRGPLLHGSRVELRRRAHAQRMPHRGATGAVRVRARRRAGRDSRRAAHPHPAQEYRLVDAATGEFERGYVNVDDMVTAQPWADDLPMHVESSRVSGS